MGDFSTESDKRVKELKEKFSGYYGCDSDIFGDNINKADISVRSIMFHYMNFFKTCKIVEKLFLHGFTRLSDYRILDFGCGNGQDLRSLIEFGANPENCYGIDFYEPALECASRISPRGMHFSSLPFLENSFEDGMFDLMFSYNTITNYGEDEDIRAMTREIRRIIKPDGMFMLICTIAETSSKNPGMNGITARIFSMDEIKNFFSGFQIIDIASTSVMKDDFEKNIIITDRQEEKVNLKVLFNMLEMLREQRSYKQFYLNGMLKHMLFGLEIIQSNMKLIIMRPA